MWASQGQNLAISAVHGDPAQINLLLYTGLSVYHLIPYQQLKCWIALYIGTNFSRSYSGEVSLKLKYIFHTYLNN